MEPLAHGDAPTAGEGPGPGGRREHLLVVSDVHLTEAEPSGGLWKRFLQREHFVDDEFAAWLARMGTELDGPVRLVLNGDIFDFDAVMAVPPAAAHLAHVERTRSLHPTEEKSAFKAGRILDDHPVFFDALRAFLEAGHALVVVLGNHDLELYWPRVQARIRERLGPAAAGDGLRFEPWFFQSGDVRIEHGHLLDPFCAVGDPREPLVELRPGEREVEIPFGNVAGRYLTNRMGYFNPNCSESYQRSAWGYVKFWVRHHLLARRPLVSAWIAGAFFTLRHALRVRGAHRARPVEGLPPPYAHPVYERLFLMVRELWFDRLGLLAFGAAVIAGFTIAFGVGLWLLPAVAGMAGAIVLWDRIVRAFVKRSDRWLESMHEAAASLARFARARILVLGHAHSWRKVLLPGGGFYLNSGTFSPSYEDIACTRLVPFSRTFVWIPPDGEPRVLEWRSGAPVVLA